MTEENNVSVLDQIARGDPAGVAACIDEFGSLVWSLARRLSPDPGEAEDAVQEIFVDIWKSAARYDPQKGSAKMFIAMIARRRLIDRLRRRAQRPMFASIEELEVAEFAEPGTQGEICVEAERAAAAVAELSATQQLVIKLAVFHGLSHGDIAGKTGLPLGTVKTQLRRGMIRVREVLGVSPAATAGGAP